MEHAVVVPCLMRSGASLPSYESAGAAGADVRALLTEPLIIKRGERALIPTGLCFEIPEGYEIQLRPRSGLALSQGITCLNAPATIDSDYRGEVRVILINHGEADVVIQNGDRIAQLVIAPVYRASFMPVQSLSASERGEAGFGSTGRS